MQCSFFEDNIFDTGVYRSNGYVHLLVRVDGLIAGFHTFQISGASMGGVLGGFNRELSRNNFVYERVIVTSLDYAIQNGLRRIHYSLVDNHTKLRLVDLREPCELYFFSRSRMNRAVFKRTFKHNDVHSLWQLERQARPREPSERCSRCGAPVGFVVAISLTPTLRHLLAQANPLDCSLSSGKDHDDRCYT